MNILKKDSNGRAAGVLSEVKHPLLDFSIFII